MSSPIVKIVLITVCLCNVISAHILIQMAGSVMQSYVLRDGILFFPTDANRVIQFIITHSDNQPIVFVLPGGPINSSDQNMSAMLREAEHDTDVRLVVINFFSFNDDRTINVRDFRDGSDLEDVLSLYGLFMMFEEIQREYVILAGNEMAIAGVGSLSPIPKVFLRFFIKNVSLSRPERQPIFRHFLIIEFEKLWRYLYSDSVHRLTH